MPRGNDTNAIPTVQEILLQYGYPKMSGHQPTCHVCCAMLMKLDMIFTSYSKLLVCKGSYLKLSGHGLCLEIKKISALSYKFGVHVYGVGYY